MMQPILYVFAFRSTDLLTATIDRAGSRLPSNAAPVLALARAIGRPIGAGKIDLKPSDWRYVDEIQSADLDALVSNANEAPARLAEAGYFHLDVKNRKRHPFYQKAGPSIE
jgi:hypothetical protein